MKDSKKGSKSQIFGSIYLIYCYVTDKCYVGQTIQRVSARIGKHKSGDQYIDKEIQKLGWKNFTYIVLEKNVPIDDLNDLERYWIRVFDCVKPKGYNRTRGGQKHFEISDELRRVRRENMLGKKNPHYGDHSPLSEETRAKKRATNIERGIRPPVMYGADNPNYGKNFSSEHRKKLSEAKKGKPPWNKGKKCPQISAGRKGIPFSEETKEKILNTFLKKKIMRELVGKLKEVLAIKKNNA